MQTHVQNAYSEKALLAFPNVRVRLRSAALPIVLSEDGTENGLLGFHWKVQERERTKLMSVLERRDWRSIRTTLLNLDFNNLDSVCEWLGSAGYVAQAILEIPNSIAFTPGDVKRMASGNLGWWPEFVTSGIRDRLEKYRDAFRWMMQRNERQFRKDIKAAHEYRTAHYETAQATANAILSDNPRTLRLRDPAKAFLEDLRAPNLDANVLGLALRGTGVSEGLPVHLYWDSKGFPAIAARCGSPLEALCISIHIDRNFSQRQAVKCVQCGKWFDPIRGRDRFCSARCRNFFLTTERRKKISLVKQAAQDWTVLPTHKKANRDRAEWIVAQVSKQTAGEYALEPSWVRKVLGTSASKSHRAGEQYNPAPIAKAVTMGGRVAKRAERK